MLESFRQWCEDTRGEFQLDAAIQAQLAQHRFQIRQRRTYGEWRQPHEESPATFEAVGYRGDRSKRDADVLFVGREGAVAGVVGVGGGGVRSVQSKDPFSFSNPTLAFNPLRPSSSGGSRGALVDQDYRLHAVSCLCHFARQTLPLRLGHLERGPQAALSLPTVRSADSILQRVKSQTKKPATAPSYPTAWSARCRKAQPAWA